MLMQRETRVFPAHPLKGETVAGAVNSDAFKMSEFTEAIAMLRVTSVASVTSPTLDVKFQTSVDLVNWFDLGSAFSQQTAAGSTLLKLSNLGRYVRAVQTVGGTTLTGHAVAAIGTVDPAGANNSIDYTAVTAGLAGNNITVAYVDPGVAGAISAAVNPVNSVDSFGNAVVTNNIVVTLGRSAAVAAALTTAMAGANNDLVITAVTPGTAGNSITIALVNGGASKKFSLSVASSAITVNLATDGSSVITTVANDILRALNTDPLTSGLVSVALAAANDGTGLVTALGATNLTGGLAAAINSTGTNVNTVISGTPAVAALVTSANSAANTGAGLVTAMPAQSLAGGQDSGIVFELDVIAKT